METIIQMNNLLFVIPHPDDELVGCCTIIRRFLNKKKKIHLFFLTNGVVSRESNWFWEKNKIDSKVEQRKSEMMLSVKLLGINNISFQNIPTRTLKNYISKTYIEIKKIIKSKKIDSIFCPAYEGGHQDHDVSNFICSKFVNKHKVYEFPEYNYLDRRINCNTFIKLKGNETIINLTKDEKEFKKKCLKVYRSEKSNLTYIKFEIESFRLLMKYDYLNPPHEGLLFYRRFSLFKWHPRVDGDKPLDIIDKIKRSDIFTK